MMQGELPEALVCWVLLALSLLLHLLLLCCVSLQHHSAYNLLPVAWHVQVSARNRWMVQSDWLRTKIFGRNITEV
jgi:hypothetical protein